MVTSILLLFISYCGINFLDYVTQPGGDRNYNQRMICWSLVFMFLGVIGIIALNDGFSFQTTIKRHE